MAQLGCPACGAPVTFQSAVTVCAVCASCGSTVVRQDAGLELIGRMAALPDDISPIQLGTVLEDGGVRYTVLGRVRVGWTDGGWNEWFLAADTGAGAWLAEAQGAFALCSERPPPTGLDQELRLGATVRVDGVDYTVADIKRATCLGSEGELPFRAIAGRQATYTDMLGPTDGFAGVEDSQEGRRCYVGRYRPLRELRPDNLRPLEGWTFRAGRAGDAADPLYAP